MNNTELSPEELNALLYIRQEILRTAPKPVDTSHLNQTFYSKDYYHDNTKQNANYITLQFHLAGKQVSKEEYKAQELRHYHMVLQCLIASELQEVKCKKQ